MCSVGHPFVTHLQGNQKEVGRALQKTTTALLTARPAPLCSGNGTPGQANRGTLTSQPKCFLRPFLPKWNELPRSPVPETQARAEMYSTRPKSAKAPGCDDPGCFDEQLCWPAPVIVPIRSCHRFAPHETTGNAIFHNKMRHRGHRGHRGHQETACQKALWLL